MALPSDLLVQAEQLATRERTRPRQASLRRAVSAAYYALFHLLTSEASRVFVKDERLWKILNRSYEHTEMSTVSKLFAEDRWPKAFDPVKGQIRLPPKLREVAKAFVNLQQARYEADYDLIKTYTRSEALMLVEQAQQAFRDWEDVRTEDVSRIYLSCFLLWKTWSKSR